MRFLVRGECSYSSVGEWGGFFVGANTRSQFLRDVGDTWLLMDQKRHLDRTGKGISSAERPPVVFAGRQSWRLLSAMLLIHAAAFVSMFGRYNSSCWAEHYTMYRALGLASSHVQT